METFTATSGNQIRFGDIGVLKVSSAMGSLYDWSLTADGVADLREFFQAERDEQMGVWRSPFISGKYARRLTENRVRIVDEATGRATAFLRGSVDGSSALADLAKHYFKAHPIHRPWHDAKPGDLWEVSVSPASRANIPPREPLPMQVMLDDSGEIRSLYFAHWNGPDAETIDVDDRHIESATLLWSVTK